FRVNSLIRGFHPSRLTKLSENPYLFAKKEGMEVKTLDDYLMLLEVMFQRAKAAGAVCLKTTVAYERSLRFENATKEAATRAFGRPPAELSAQDIQDFEDFIMWR